MTKPTITVMGSQVTICCGDKDTAKRLHYTLTKDELIENIIEHGLGYLRPTLEKQWDLDSLERQLRKRKQMLKEMI